MNSSRGLRVLSVLLTGLFAVTVSMSAPASAAGGIEETTGPETAAVPIDPELLELAETQTPAEIEDLVESDQPLDTLYDPDAQSYVAARPAEPVIEPFAVTTKCLNNPARLYSTFGSKQTIRCFTGTGALDGVWARTFKVSAGGVFTGAWYNTTGGATVIGTRAGGTTTFTRELTILSVTRG